jgi:hypothetical protein
MDQYDTVAFKPACSVKPGRWIPLQRLTDNQEQTDFIAPEEAVAGA